MARASADAMPSCSHRAVAPAATAWRAMSGACHGGLNTSTSPTLLGDVSERPVDLLAEDLVGVRVDRDDAPAMSLHMRRHGVRRLGSRGTGADHGNGVVSSQDALDHGVCVGHSVTGYLQGGCPVLRDGKETRNRPACFCLLHKMDSLQYSHVPVPAPANPNTGGSTAAALRRRPVRVEPVRRAGILVACRTRPDAGIRGTV